MLMTIGGVLAAAVLLVISLVMKKAWLRNFVLGGVTVWFVFYAILLFGFSLASKEKVLGLNEAKEYCGFYLDCHMHTAVTQVQRAKTIGAKTARGEFYIVTVKVSSDAKREPLQLIGTEAKIFDEQKNSYTRDLEAEQALGSQPEFETMIAPAETFTKTIVFDLPTRVKEPRLDIRDGYGVDTCLEAVLIGDEDSVFHQRSYFILTAQDLARRAN
ncbi:MAG TPA: DUF4352 domain-containing protein [Pyrinomonadaceae bacterium]|nr:DUF4352 domain-containing protein [Pyrinomonadaceae bacterium]